MRQPYLLLAPLAGLLLLACGDGLYPEDAFTPTPSVTPMPSPTPFVRGGCDGVRERGRYADLLEHDWFIANCASRPYAAVGFNYLPLAGYQMMEFYAVPDTICPSGKASTTIDEETNGELFSYLFRTFCEAGPPSPYGPPPPPLSCPPDETLTPQPTVLPYVTGFTRTATELLCLAATPTVTPTPPGATTTPVPPS